MPMASLERGMIEGPGARSKPISTTRAANVAVSRSSRIPIPSRAAPKDNKVVTTLAKAFFALDYVAVRPNFRGVGASGGAYDEGRGETEDMLAVAGYLKTRFGKLPLVLAGFSFGSFVQTRVAKRLAAERLVLSGRR